ncbi:hypothetical protein N7541_008467 [Penicillium brevicompactum]|uniref:Uncharacterized protein n=1 Tax=Penicillium brevicompactum TaxID=5074 RepID=A0A9W9UPH0_PENBR|nr:hypothetical protein N7541_008467 [Penicillium brevicompactum]
MSPHQLSISFDSESSATISPTTLNQAAVNGYHLALTLRPNPGDLRGYLRDPNRPETDRVSGDWEGNVPGRGNTSSRRLGGIGSFAASVEVNPLDTFPNIPFRQSSSPHATFSSSNMQSSNWATTTHDGDAMDIDSGAPPSAPRGPRRQTQNAPVQRANRQYRRVTRHVFYIPVTFNVTFPSDMVVVGEARSSISRMFNAGTAHTIAATFSPENRIPHVMIALSANHDNRERALSSVFRRLGQMLDMMQDGLGWLHPLPYRHPHFKVEVVHNYDERR